MWIPWHEMAPRATKPPRSMSNLDIHGVRVEWPGACKRCGKPNNVWYDHAKCAQEDLRRAAEQIGRRAARYRDEAIYNLIVGSPTATLVQRPRNLVQLKDQPGTTVEIPFRWESRWGYGVPSLWGSARTTNKPSDEMLVHGDLIRMTDQPQKETPMKTKKEPCAWHPSCCKKSGHHDGRCGPVATKKKSPAPKVEIAVTSEVPKGISVTYGCDLCGEDFETLYAATQHQDLIRIATLIDKLEGGGLDPEDPDAFCGQADDLARGLKPDPEALPGMELEAQHTARTTAKELIAALTRVYLR